MISHHFFHNRGTSNPTCASTHCIQDNASNPVCLGGGCSQMNSSNPSCAGSHCNQEGSTNASCLGTQCNQVNVVNANCQWGCDQRGATDPICLGGGCCRENTKQPKASCKGGIGQTGDNSCGPKAKGCGLRLNIDVSVEESRYLRA